MTITPDVSIATFSRTKAAVTGVSQNPFSEEEIIKALEGIISIAFKEFGVDLPICIKFGHLNFFAGRHLHAELCRVEIGSGMISLNFPLIWLDRVSNNYLRNLTTHVICIAPILSGVIKSIDTGLVEFLFELGDSAYLEAVAFSSKNNFGCLIPDPIFFASGAYEANRVGFGEMFVEWDDRTPLIFWRGNSTGQRRHRPDINDESFGWLHRLQFVRQCRRSPHASSFDVGISEVVQVDDVEIRDYISKCDLLRPRVSKMAFISYKSIIDIDGNSNAWSGFYTALLSGSCVFKVTSERGFRQWFYEDLIPFHHYVPIAWDLCDLDEAATWFKRSDSAAKIIGSNGRSFSEGLTLAGSLEKCGKRFVTWLSR